MLIETSETIIYVSHKQATVSLPEDVFGAQSLTMAFRGGNGLEALLQRPERPSVWSRFITSPIKFLASALYSCLNPQKQDPRTGVHIVCISDTHNTQPSLPDGDVLLHAGDLTQSGTLDELNTQIAWLDKQPHEYKVVIAGNHELCLDPRKRRNVACGDNDRNERKTDSTMQIDWRSLIYLQDSSVTLEFENGGNRRLKVYGSPWTPKHGNWAFEYPRTAPSPWKDAIPAGTDILLTHGPPKAHLDLQKSGCHHLLQETWLKKPTLHVFGHIHGGYGRESLIWDSFQATYERIVGSDGPWADLAKLVWYGICRLVRRRATNKHTTMVNAAAIGGLRDNERRNAITVVL